MKRSSQKAESGEREEEGRRQKAEGGKRRAESGERETTENGNGADRLGTADATPMAAQQRGPTDRMRWGQRTLQRRREEALQELDWIVGAAVGVPDFEVQVWGDGHPVARVGAAAGLSHSADCCALKNR